MPASDSPVSGPGGFREIAGGVDIVLTGGVALRVIRWALVLVVVVASALVVAHPAAALPGIVVVSTSLPADSVAKKAAEAACPQGLVPFGGGAEVDGGGDAVRLISSFPAGNSWVVFAREHADGYAGDWSMRAWVICGKEPPGYQTVSAHADGSLTSAAVTATCPAGRKVLGVGGSAVFGSLHAVLDTIRPLPGLGGVKVEAFADGPGVTEPIHAMAAAVCAMPGFGLQMVSLSTPSSSSAYKTISVGCPPGTDAHGVSASLSGAIGGAHIDGMSVFSIGVYAVARERPGGYRGSWKLEVFAVCAM